MLNWRNFLAPAQSTIQEAILKFLSRKKVITPENLPNLTDQTHFSNDLGMESLDVVELMMNLEQRYKIDFDQASHVPCLSTLGALSKFTNQLIHEKSLV